MLNDEDVRSGLAKEGVALPGSTYFLAAEHNTTTDEVVIFDADRIPPPTLPTSPRFRPVSPAPPRPIVPAAPYCWAERRVTC